MVRKAKATAFLPHEFRDPGLRDLALTHPSVQPVTGLNYQRLEFLGDAVLGMILADELVYLHPQADEGQMTRWRSALSSRKAVTEVAREMGLQRLVEVKGTSPDNDTVLSCCLEALVGAVYLDGGLGDARRFVRRAWGRQRIEGVHQEPTRDFKTQLQEASMKDYWTTPAYDTFEVDGGFRSTVKIKGIGKFTGKGASPSKKEAEQATARYALERLQYKGYHGKDHQ